MHHSGTSLLTRILIQMGLYGGQRSDFKLQVRYSVLQFGFHHMHLNLEKQIRRSAKVLGKTRFDRHQRAACQSNKRMRRLVNLCFI